MPNRILDGISRSAYSTFIPYAGKAMNTEKTSKMTDKTIKELQSSLISTKKFLGRPKQSSLEIMKDVTFRQDVFTVIDTIDEILEKIEKKYS